MTFAPSLLGRSFLALGFGGNWEWLIILFIVLLLFGRRLPGVARSLGQGISSFKQGLNEPVDEPKSAAPQQPAAPAQPPASEQPKEPKTEQPSDA